MPSVSQISSCMYHSIDSGPGKDGIPYSGLRHSRLHESPLPLLLDDAMTSFRHFSPSSPLPPLCGFNDNVVSCIPKKETLPYMNGVACRASGTRSLSCKNTVNKILCKAVAYQLMPTVQASASEPQKGFIANRHFTDNILILDTLSRVYSNLYKRYGNAVLAFFDFSSAFPSVALDWMFAVLIALGAPPGLSNFVAALYHSCHSYIKHQGR
eukprot:11161489-Karenia_brevis.AAC.1